MSRGLTFEFEDVIASADDWAVIDAVEGPAPEARGRNLWRARNAAALYLDRSAPATGDELVFVVAQTDGDLVDFMGERRLIRGASCKAVFIEELWIRNISMRADIRRFLESFDHIFVGTEATIAPLSELVDQPVSHLPPSVDQDRFAASPWPEPVIDAFAMGRRNPRLHEALLQWAAADHQRMYHFDTVTNNPAIVDHVEHRMKLADFIRRCRYFIVNAAKVDRVGETGGQAEVGYRFYEGAAAGTILVGPAVDAPAFERNFGWEDALVTVDPTGADIAEVIKELDEDPERRAAIRRNNVRNSLRMHDHIHRWQTVLERLELEVPPGVTGRIDRLNERSATADPAGDG